MGEGEFVFDSDTNTVTIRNGTKVLFEGEFLIVDDTTVRVCQSDYIVEPEKTSQLSLLSRAHNVFSYVFTLMSLFCLLLTFTTYCLFLDLRTVPGKNIMSLCVSLFVAQGSLQFSSFILTNEVICVPFAILTHYSWLATFCAMNVCSFHMYRLFYFRMMSSPEALRSFNHNKYYLLYTYTLPLAVVVLTVVVHLGASKGEFTGYGKFACFISDIYTIVFTFIVPATMIFVTNFAFFAIAFHAIRTSPRIGTASKNRREFFMYLKLCTLTGIAWPLQVIDGLLPLTAFSFVAVFINALQGVYIFVSYVCNKRVLKLFATLWAGQPDSPVDKKNFASGSGVFDTSSTKTLNS
ncbi:MAG: Mth family G-protein coupled receptor [Candidatus Thiodiazotropha sp.]